MARRRTGAAAVRARRRPVRRRPAPRRRSRRRARRRRALACRRHRLVRRRAPGRRPRRHGTYGRRLRRHAAPARRRDGRPRRSGRRGTGRRHHRRQQRRGHEAPARPPRHPPRDRRARLRRSALPPAGARGTASGSSARARRAHAGAGSGTHRAADTACLGHGAEHRSCAAAATCGARPSGRRRACWGGGEAVDDDRSLRTPAESETRNAPRGAARCVPRRAGTAERRASCGRRPDGRRRARRGCRSDRGTSRPGAG
jgi:hypothetical protein